MILEPRQYVGKYVAKTVRTDALPPFWKDDYSTEWRVQYNEAYRLARAGDIAALFLFEAGHEKGALVHGRRCTANSVCFHSHAHSNMRPVDFRIAPTYIVTGPYGAGWIVQKVLSGEAYPSQADSQTTSFLARTLSAFAHYTIERHGLYLDSYEGDLLLRIWADKV